MGQYWIPVNLDKREYVDPHKLGTGLKLWEQIANHPSTGVALLILCAAMPEARGGGDLEPDPIIGRWAGDRIAIIGDYAEDDDLTPKAGDPPAGQLYFMCRSDAEWRELVEDWQKDNPLLYERAIREKWAPFKDVTDDVCRVIENELDGKFTGDGWRHFERNKEAA